jgi:hypothetical protein
MGHPDRSTLQEKLPWLLFKTPKTQRFFSHPVQIGIGGGIGLCELFAQHGSQRSLVGIALCFKLCHSFAQAITFRIGSGIRVGAITHGKRIVTEWRGCGFLFAIAGHGVVWLLASVSGGRFSRP